MRVPAIFSVILISLFCLIAGCAQLRGPDEYWVKPEQARPGSKAVSLLYYAGYAGSLGSGDLARELERARTLYANEKSDFRALQYALALAQPGSDSRGDTRKAQQIVEALQKEGRPTDPELAALAQWLNADLMERRRLESDGRRAEAGAKRAGELEKKVEALKNIEKGLMQRDTRGVGVNGPEDKQ